MTTLGKGAIAPDEHLSILSDLRVYAPGSVLAPSFLAIRFCPQLPGQRSNLSRAIGTSLSCCAYREATARLAILPHFLHIFVYGQKQIAELGRRGKRVEQHRLQPPLPSKHRQRQKRLVLVQQMLL